MVQEDIRLIPLTTNDIHKLHADQIAFSKMVVVVPPPLFEHIMLYKSAKEIYNTLQDLFEGLGNMKDKRLISVVNDFDTFTTTVGESVTSTLNRHKIMVNSMMTYGVIQTPVEYKLKFINSLIKGWGNLKSYIQSNGSLKKLKIYHLFDEIQGHESNVAQTLRELPGGSFALVSTVDPLIMNPIVSDPFKVIPPTPPIPPTLF